MREGTRVRARIRRLFEHKCGTPSGGNLLHVGGGVGEPQQEKSAEQDLAFREDVDLLAIGKESAAKTSSRVGNIAKEFGRNDNRRRCWGTGILHDRRRLLPRLLLWRNLPGKDIAVAT